MIKMLVEILRNERGYIDLGTGSMMIQILIASFVGGLFIVKGYWRKIVGKIKSLMDREGSNSGKQKS